MLYFRTIYVSHYCRYWLQHQIINKLNLNMGGRGQRNLSGHQINIVFRLVKCDYREHICNSFLMLPLLFSYLTVTPAINQHDMTTHVHYEEHSDFAITTFHKRIKKVSQFTRFFNGYFKMDGPEARESEPGFSLCITCFILLRIFYIIKN